MSGKGFHLLYVVMIGQEMCAQIVQAGGAQDDAAIDALRTAFESSPHKPATLAVDSKPTGFFASDRPNTIKLSMPLAEGELGAQALLAREVMKGFIQRVAPGIQQFSIDMGGR